MDTWATSSLTPQIALKWIVDPAFFKKMYPMSLRPQAYDIVSFWMFNTVVKGYLHHKQLPWKNTMISGWALDPKGKKMSKSKGNVIDPQEMIKKYSADALRFWASSTKLGEDLAFAEKEFIAGQRTMNKLWNAANFVSTHVTEYDRRKPAQLTILDRWMLSKLQRLVKECTDSFESYEYIRVRLGVEKFFWQTFCDNYLEFSKDRLYNQANYDSHLVQGAKEALYSALLAQLKLFAPILPHITEELYQTLFKEKEHSRSIHVSKWPAVGSFDEEAEKFGDVFVELNSMVRKYKSEKKLSLKFELTKIIIDVEDPIKLKLEEMGKEAHAILKVKEISYGKTEAIKGNSLNVEIVE